MAVPTAITDLSTTASSNSPSGSENPKEGDNHLRAGYSFIRTLYNWLTDGLSAITCAALTAKGNVVLGDAAGDTLNVAAGAITVDASGDVAMSGDLAVTGAASAGGIELGFRDIPFVTHASPRTLVITDRGKFVAPSAGSATVTIPAGVFSQGHVVSVINLSGASLTLAGGVGVTLYLGGTLTTGDRTLAINAMTTIVFYDGSTALVSGSGLS